jgi:hypothetical protein
VEQALLPVSRLSDPHIIRAALTGCARGWMAGPGHAARPGRGLGPELAATALGRPYDPRHAALSYG